MFTMSYKSYEFPYNPSTLKISCKRVVKEFVSIFSQAVAQDLGILHRKISCEGELAMEDQLEFLEWANGCIAETTAGTLNISGQGTYNNCRMIVFELIYPPISGSFRYRLEFMGKVGSSMKMGIVQAPVSDLWREKEADL